MDYVYSDEGRQRFNATLLAQYNYMIYSNNTLSNVSKCYLALDGYKPIIISNGTIYNGTGCETPIYAMAARGGLGIAVSLLFALGLILVLTCLKKHGKSHIPVQKRFRPISRRWSWYWLLTTCAVGMISGLMAIDVDRDLLQGTALILSSIFYLCTLPTTLAALWEVTRHWASFHERQIYDEDPFRLRPDDLRSKIEFYAPLVFYLIDFLVFFLSILRTWIPVAKSNSAASTDTRFKAASLFGLLAWSFILGFFFITRYHYKPQLPRTMIAAIVVTFVRVAYTIVCAWSFDISPLNHKANAAYIYAFGYLPILTVVAILVLRGFKVPNEDLELIRLRRARARSFNSEMANLKPKRLRPVTIGSRG